MTTFEGAERGIYSFVIGCGPFRYSVHQERGGFGRFVRMRSIIHHSIVLAFHLRRTEHESPFERLECSQIFEAGER